MRSARVALAGPPSRGGGSFVSGRRWQGGL
ncbi:hypothetical protein HNQ09_001722 [Deinococcus budaensis]|uniref:Uncharacterized protein n=1 Tax=Deinococcus budaensis TaxID=1665626 RepID=A0A7W8GF98_9DEIO|nr:hypothetical protein [Deinococcus budaensis]